MEGCIYREVKLVSGEGWMLVSEVREKLIYVVQWNFVSCLGWRLLCGVMLRPLSGVRWSLCPVMVDICVWC